MDRSKALAVFSALSHEARLDLIRLLVPASPEGLSAGEIARSLGLSSSRLSFHLAAMEQAGLLTSRRVARNIFYSVDAERLGGVVGWLLHDCCMKHPQVMECSRHRSEAPQPAEGAPDLPDGR